MIPPKLVHSRDNTGRRRREEEEEEEERRKGMRKGNRRRGEKDEGRRWRREEEEEERRRRRRRRVRRGERNKSRNNHYIKTNALSAARRSRPNDSSLVSVSLENGHGRLCDNLQCHLCTMDPAYFNPVISTTWVGGWYMVGMIEWFATRTGEAMTLRSCSF